MSSHWLVACYFSNILLGKKGEALGDKMKIDRMMWHWDNGKRFVGWKFSTTII